MDFDPDAIPNFIKSTPIPEVLFSVYESGPFKTCTVCGEVLTDGRLYEIQKVFRGKEAVFEMAVCHKCGENVSKEFSEQSMENIKNFLLANFKPTLEPLHCHFCGFPRGLISSFTIVGACKENSLILPSVIMCEKCGERLQEKLSRKTREVQGDFIHDNFPGVPADLDLSPNLSGLFT
ncbi:MAG: hypothetical protein HY717_16195 [Planctomycetes bacterium]|nr:hypothetical protein [Planctomycetota bacterium]